MDIKLEIDKGLNKKQCLIKRTFDLFIALFGIICFSWILVPAYILASIDTRSNGFFIQKRVGKRGNLFPMIKIRTMRKDYLLNTNVTTNKDPRITPLGRFWRRTKIDELPQLINIILGHMSFVGPRPDVPGFADNLKGEDQIILSVRPGITGPATLKYRKEEEILARKEDPEKYNIEVIWPDKVKINRQYVENYSFIKDLKYIWQTIF